jgi:hypothetical protein
LFLVNNSTLVLNFTIFRLTRPRNSPNGGKKRDWEGFTKYVNEFKCLILVSKDILKLQDLVFQPENPTRQHSNTNCPMPDNIYQYSAWSLT